MRLTIPEIAWHDTKPIYSCDIQRQEEDDWVRLATAGGDKIIRIWKLDLDEKFSGETELLASLRRHEKPVNCVRWSPSGSVLASAGDDSIVLLWRKNAVRGEGGCTLSCFREAEDDYIKESWTVFRTLRRHLEDIYDLCWSDDSECLLSGSVDHSAVLWSGETTNKSLLLMDHKHFVQGVAYDPLGQYVATESSDRTFRIYKAGSRNCQNKVGRISEQKDHLFQDDSWKSFFRRLSFSPDGKLLVTPAGLINLKANYLHFEKADGHQSLPKLAESIPSNIVDKLDCTSFGAHIFVRNNFSRPVASIPTQNRPVVGVRFCQQKFAVKGHHSLLFRLSSSAAEVGWIGTYRWIFALVLQDAALVCDTEQRVPLCLISNIHYQALNDATWSHDGRCLVLCSTDGYCTIVNFKAGELGKPFVAQTILTEKSLIYNSPKLPAEEQKSVNRKKRVSFSEKENFLQCSDNVKKDACVSPKVMEDSTVNQLCFTEKEAIETVQKQKDDVTPTNRISTSDKATNSTKRRRVEIVTLDDYICLVESKKEQVSTTSAEEVANDVPKKSKGEPKSALKSSNSLSKTSRRVSFTTLK